MNVKATPDLVEGDVVLTHGMRVLIDGTPQKDFRGTTFYRGLVLNEDAVREAGVVPMHWLRLHSDDPRWAIKGNELARWFVEAVTA